LTELSEEDKQLQVSIEEYNETVRRRFVFVGSFLLISALVIILTAATIVFRPSVYSLFSSSNPESADYQVPAGLQNKLNPSFGNSQLFELDEKIRDIGDGIEHPTIRSAFSAFHQILDNYRIQFERGAAQEAFKFEIEVQTSEKRAGVNWKLGDHLVALDKVTDNASEYLRPGMETGAREALELLISTANQAKRLHTESDQSTSFAVVSASEQ